jgi:divinyl protochlorophyllide a 8-vinyl-reductase
VTVLPSARIGPNAILRTIEALRALHGEADADEILVSCGLEKYLLHMPEEMVAESEVAALYEALRQRFAPDDVCRIARDAGYRTADYLLLRRIPAFAQSLLAVLPEPWARRGLMLAMRANSWTFAGSAAVGMRFGAPASITLAGCPICRDAKLQRPACDYYAGTFERLFKTLVAPTARVEEVACQAEGACACVFQIQS